MTNRKSILTLIAVLAGYAFADAVCIALTRATSGIATVWLANAVLAVGMMVLPRRWAIAATAGCFALNVGGNLYGGDALPASLTFACINIIESTLSALTGRRILGPRLRITGMRRLGMLGMVSAIGVAAVGATLAASIFHEAFHRSFSAVFIDWLFAVALGTGVVMTALLVLRQSWDRRWDGAGRLESIALLSVIPIASAVNYVTVREPVMFLSFPLLILIAFRMGPRGAAIGALTLFAGALPIALGAPVPHFAVDWDLAGRIRLMQIFIAGAFASSLASALAVEQQARLRRLLERRNRMAREARARANAANRAKGEFLAAMSHEIRTPLNSVLGFTGVLLGRRDLPSEARRQIELIDRAGESLLSMLGDVLDFSKIEAGEVEIVTAPADIVDQVRGALELIAPAAQAKGLEMHFETDTEAAWRHLDARHLRQVLLNLLSNAVKFTVHGRVSLSLTTRVSGEVRIAVHDTGIGIDQQAAQKLFRRFHQADGSVSRRFGGTGLGLAICKGLVGQMGGDIEVESRIAEGSCFTLVLPLRPARPPAKRPPRSLAAQLRGLNVLLIDDHAANREIAKALLGAAGCKVTTADSGKAGLAALEDARFDVVLLDLHMPQLDGLATARLITADPDAPPVIAMSADVLPHHIDRCLAAGMVDHIAKPIPRDKLYDTVAKWGAKATDKVEA